MAPKAEPDDEGALDRPLTDRRIGFLCALVSAALFMEMLDASVILTALPAMAQSFGVAPIDLNLGVSLYLLAVAVFVPVSGWLAERYGTRRVFVSAIVLFTVSSALCGASTNVTFFVAMRVLQGISGAMMVPVGRLLVMRITPRSQLMDRLSQLIWPALVAPVLGPALGGLITAHLGWRWIFYVNIPVGIAALVAAVWLVPNLKGETRRAFDLYGFILAGLGLAATLIGIEWLVGDVPATGAALVAAGTALLWLCWKHLRRAAHPMLDLSPFFIETFRACVRGGTINRAAIGSVPFILPLMLQTGFGLPPDVAGLMVLCVFLGNLAMKAFTTPILRRFGFRRTLLTNGIVSAASLMAFVFLAPTTSQWILVAVFFWSGASRSLQFTAYSTLAYADISQARMSDATALFSAILQLTGAASIAVGTIGIRIGAAFNDLAGVPLEAGGYRLAFAVMALLSLIGLLDVLRLQNCAGDQLLAK